MSEIKGDLPPFLKPRAEQRAEEEIQRWKEARRQLLEKIEKVLREYRIVGGLDKNGKPEGTDKGKMGMEYQFETAGQGRWQVLVGKKMEYTPPPDLEDWQRAEIERDLTINQALGGVSSGQEQAHQRVINFLAANWKTLAGIFYPIEIEQTEGIEPVGFSEVYLAGRERADFLGIGPDGRYLVFEVGRGGKQPQIEKYRQGLVKMEVPEEMIMGFTINYSQAARQTTLLIRQVF